MTSTFQDNVNKTIGQIEKSSNYQLLNSGYEVDFDVYYLGAEGTNQQADIYIKVNDKNAHYQIAVRQLLINRLSTMTETHNALDILLGELYEEVSQGEQAEKVWVIIDGANGVIDDAYYASEQEAQAQAWQLFKEGKFEDDYAYAEVIQLDKN